MTGSATQDHGETAVTGTKLPGNLAYARNGALLLSGGRHSTAALFNGDNPPSAESVAAFWDNHASRSAYCAERGLPYLMTVFPDKLVPYRDQLPGVSKLDSLFARSYMPGAAEGQSHEIAYPEVGLDDYLLTDTHFSANGMATVTKQILQRVGITDFAAFDAHCDAHRVTIRGHAGDLGVQCEPHVTEDAELLKSVARGRYASNGVTGNDGIIDINVNEEAATGQTLLIFGDSFFRQILPLLTFFYRRVFFLRSRYFHDEMVAAIAPDVIFCGTAERYLSNVQSDRDRPHALAYPMMLGRQIRPTAKFGELWSEVVDSKALGRPVP